MSNLRWGWVFFLLTLGKQTIKTLPDSITLGNCLHIGVKPGQPYTQHAA